MSRVKLDEVVSAGVVSFVYCQRDVLHDCVDYRALCKCGVDSGWVSFDSQAVRDCMYPVQFVAGTLRGALDERGCTCRRVDLSQIKKAPTTSPYSGFFSSSGSTIANLAKAYHARHDVILKAMGDVIPRAARSVRRNSDGSDWASFRCEPCQAELGVRINADDDPLERCRWVTAQYRFQCRCSAELTAAECLTRYTNQQHQNDVEGCRAVAQDLLTPAQKDAARSAWSAALRARVDAAKEKERRQIVCDDDRWEA